MRLVRECFECGDIAEHWHHVLPASIGGTRMVPLCRDCHTAIHAPGQPLSISSNGWPIVYEIDRRLRGGASVCLERVWAGPEYELEEAV